MEMQKTRGVFCKKGGIGERIVSNTMHEKLSDFIDFHDNIPSTPFLAGLFD